MKTHRTTIIGTNAKATLVAFAALLCTAGIATGFAQSVSTPAPTLLWNFDSITEGTTSDSSGNGNNGAVTGTVATATSGLSGSTGALTGFSSASSQVYYDSGVSNLLETSGKATVTLWFQNPGTSTRNLLTGFGAISNGGERAVEIWLTDADEGGNRTLNLSYQPWTNATADSLTATSASLTLEADSWYQLAFVWERQAGNTYNYTVYLTSEKASGLGTALLSGSVNPAPSTSRWFYVGGNPGGWYNTHFKAGFLGATASIDEVSLWIGTALTTDQLNANFALHAFTGTIPEPGAVAALCGFAGLIAASVIRHRRQKPAPQHLA
ncbi:MAG: LamG domain-containing protein [Opitutaceae bacterium]|nr:LamG domain-containing protein [Opitutaceae bacterium]